jgi:hypothetical protein
MVVAPHVDPYVFASSRLQRVFPTPCVDPFNSRQFIQHDFSGGLKASASLRSGQRLVERF